MENDNRIVITVGDLANGSQTVTEAKHSSKVLIPWWERAIAWLFAASFPLLSVFAVSVRLAVRKRPAATREAWKGLLGTALIVSGLTNLAAIAWYGVIR